ncbi:serine/threonine-protein kinase [Streptomyces sp. Da 82-17]|uniref:serine/threonine-protein kinase n=1 Tax=Streptomyces sp. Da 82-17 TaxID=3377116 RepID=UPI0038D4DB2E
MGSANDDRNGGPGRIEPLSELDPPTIGPYRLLGRLGAGGMGRVYLARSAGGRTVAVKVVHEEHTSDQQFRARFRREIRAARRVGEEFTAPVLEADPDAARPWVATGYVPGLSLEDVVREYGPLPAESVHALADGLLHALRGIHAADIVHRDLKPSNVMLTVDGPRVIDFGIARAVQTSVESLLTSTGMAIGSPGFMAPEQVLAEKAGPRADVFALGCVLTYAATGRLAFGHGASNQHALMYRIVEAEPDLDLVSDAALRALIARCLTKKPDERPDVAELLADPARPRPAARRGAWLPGEVVAELAQQSARLLDAEAPTPAAGLRQAEPEEEPEPTPAAPVPEPAPAAVPEAEPEPDAESNSEPEPAPAPAEASGPSDRSTVRLRPGTDPDPDQKAPPEATPAPALEATSEPKERRRSRSRAWLVVAAVLAVLATGGTVYLIDNGPDTRGAGTPGRSASPDPGADSPSPSPSKDADDKEKGDGEEKKKDDEKGRGSAGGTDAGAGSGGASGDRPPADDNADDGADAPDSGGSSGSGGSDGGGDAAPSGDVPSYFIGGWQNDSAFGGPTRITVQQASNGGRSVTFYGSAGAPGQTCVNVARLISVQNGGSRLNLDTAAVDTSRSSAGCSDMDPSYLDAARPSGLKFFKNKDFTQSNQAWTFTRAD